MTQGKQTLEVEQSTCCKDQFWVTGSSDAEGEFERHYVSFSGFYGTFGPHVFAAAPEMLAALKAADAHFTGTFSENGTDHQLIRAAIAKAEGLE